MLFRTIALGGAINGTGGWVVLEQPPDYEETVAIWEMQVVMNFLAEIGAAAVDFDQEPWGSGTGKPTRVAGTLEGLQALEPRIERVRGTPRPKRAQHTFKARCQRRTSRTRRQHTGK